MKPLNILFTYWLFQSILSVWAQTQPVFTHLGLEDGLSGPVVRSIYQDSVGFIWFGTDTGLSRYDGRQMKNYVFDPEHPEHNYPGGFVSQILEDHKGQMWIRDAFLGGLSVYLPKRDSFRTYLQNENFNIWSFYPDQSGRMWIGTTEGLYLWKLESGSIQAFSTLFDFDLEPFLVVNISEDTRGHLWFSDPDGIYQFAWADSSLEYHDFREKQGRTPLDRAVTTQVFQDSKENLWVGTQFGLYKFDSSLNKFSLFPLQESSGQTEPGVKAIVELDEGKLWVGTQSSYLFAVDTKSGSVVNYSDSPDDAASLRSDNINSLYRDRDGNIWVATLARGVYFWGKHRKSFFSYQHYSGLASSNEISFVSGFAESQDGKIWVAGGNSLNLFDPESNTFTYDFNQISAFRVLEDRAGMVWAGDWGTGLYGLYPDRKRVIRFQVGINSGGVPGNEISEIFIDRDDQIFVGLWGKSLFRFFPEHGTFQSIPLIHPQSKDTIGLFIRHIFEDRTGGKWIGTNNEVIQLDQHGDILNVYDIPTFMTHQDQHGQIWLASRFGLYELNPETGAYKLWRKNEGLPHHIVFSILEDDHGGLWIGTQQGLAYLDPQTGKIRSFDHHDGLPSSYFMPPAAYKTRSGEFYFGMSGGMLRFHPDSIKLNPRLPAIVLTDIRINSKAVPIRGSLADTLVNQSPLTEQIVYTQNIHLNWQQNNIFFEFANLNYQNPENNQYQYLLENYDSEWSIAEAQNPTANYTNLKPGKYIFRVIGANNDDLWNRESVSLNIFIAPPWWQTWVAYTLYGIIFIGAGYIFFRWRTNSLRKQRQLLRTRVFEQTKEIRAEQQRSDELLLNILPAEVAHELKTTGKTRPVFFEEVSIMFADFKGFTNIVASIPGKKLVSELDEIFQAYDEIIEEVGLEKIQTVGDGYLAACGLPTPDPNHAKKCVIAARKIIAFLEERNQREGIKWRVRIGIHSGSITAGVIGKKKFAYDLFGDTVNIASRIESASEPGRINVSAYTYTLIQDQFPCEYRGQINAKGKGELDMYFVNN